MIKLSDVCNLIEGALCDLDGQILDPKGLAEVTCMFVDIDRNYPEGSIEVTFKERSMTGKIEKTKYRISVEMLK